MVKPVLEQARELWEMGWAIHWLKPRSKVPINSKWNDGKRADWETLKHQYRLGMNPGVKLGLSSKLKGGYLAVLDLDIKSEDPRHRDEAWQALYELYPQTKTAPYLLSGRGGGSAHVYIKLPKPVSGNEVKAASQEIVKVRMPSAPPSKKENDDLSIDEIADGIRLRRAWEIQLLSSGRQAAVAGAIHPDTGSRYVWGRPLTHADDLPLLIVVGDEKKKSPHVSAGTPEVENNQIQFIQCRIEDFGLTEEQIAAVKDGSGVTDRSAAIFSTVLALVHRGATDAQIMSLLTRSEYYLGQAAYVHSKTTKRLNAAQWVFKYNIVKAREQVQEVPFDLEIEVETPMVETQPQVPDAQKIQKSTTEGTAETPAPDTKTKTKTTAKKLAYVPPGFSNPPKAWERLLQLTGPQGKLKVISSLHNVLLILENRAADRDFLRRDLFSLKDWWVCETPWGNTKGQPRAGNDDDALRIKEWIMNCYSVEIPLIRIHEAMTIVALRNAYHPLREYLDSLQWDGIPRIDSAFKRLLGADMPEPYLSEVSRRFFMACVHRAFHPGCKFDYVVVLEGRQGTGKSTFIEKLAGLGWFLDGLPNVADKDASLYLQGTWIVELAELDAVFKSTNEATKAFVTRRVDKFRPPYGRTREDFPRVSVMVGSTNDDNYLSDPSGNRRYWPVRIKKCDFKAVEKERDQLWAEAVFHYWFDRIPLFLEGEAADQATLIQESRRGEDQGDIMHALFTRWLRTQKMPGQGRRLKVHMADLFHAGPFMAYPESRTNINHATRTLTSLGFVKTHTKHGKRWEIDPKKIRF